MPATRSSARTSTASSSRTPKRGPHAATLLKEEHAELAAMFERYEKIKAKATAAQKAKLAGEICDFLTRHAEMEEAILYPALRKAFDDQETLDEAEVEHAGAKDLIEQIRGMRPDDDLYDAKVKVLGEGVKHHVKEEEGEMLKEARACDVDLAALGAEMDAFRKSAKGGKARATGGKR